MQSNRTFLPDGWPLDMRPRMPTHLAPRLLVAPMRTLLTTLTVLLLVFLDCACSATTGDKTHGPGPQSKGLSTRPWASPASTTVVSPGARAVERAHAFLSPS